MLVTMLRDAVVNCQTHAADTTVDVEPVIAGRLINAGAAVHPNAMDGVTHAFVTNILAAGGDYATVHAQVVAAMETGFMMASGTPVEAAA